MKISPIIIPLEETKKVKTVTKEKKKQVNVAKQPSKKTIKPSKPLTINKQLINEPPVKIKTIPPKKKTETKKKYTPSASEENREFIKDEEEWKKGPIQETPEKIKTITNEEEEWKKGPAPSKKEPPENQYAFQPTAEEVELMKELQSEKRRTEILKPTPEEEAIMERVREPDLTKEFKPTNQELDYMKQEGVIKEEMPETPRSKTGIAGIDELTNGGFPKNKCIAIVGGPGTGKSILLMQYLVNGARKYGEPGIYVTFEEEIEELKENFKGLKFGIKELEKKGLLKIVHYSPMRVKRFVKNMDVTFRDLIKSVKAKRIVIDSLSAFTLLYGSEGDQREGLFELFQTLKELGVTTLLSTESWREPTMLSKSGIIEFISDGVLMLYNLKIGDTRIRALEVLKMRGIKHESRIVPFKILDEGIKVFTDEEVFGVKRRELVS